MSLSTIPTGAAIAVLGATALSPPPGASTPRQLEHSGDLSPLPVVLNVSPHVLKAGGGQTVNVHGKHFIGPRGVCDRSAKVSFGQLAGETPANYGTRIKIISDSRLSVQSPASYAGQVHVIVSNICGSSHPGSTDIAHFTYARDGQCQHGTCAVPAQETDRPFRRNAWGLLDGITARVPNIVNQRLRHLRLHTWRMSGPSPFEWATAVKSRASIVLLLEYDWLECRDCGDVRHPWRHLNRFARFVRTDVAQRRRSHQLPSAWDIWNEPNTDATTAQWLALYDTAYANIKALIPKARVIGPSIGAFGLRSSNTGLALLPFIRHVEAKHQHYAAISYHDEGNGGGAPIYGPWLLRHHAMQLHRILQKYAAWRHTKISINEYGTVSNTEVPGWIAGDIGALNSPVLTSGNLTCGTPAACITGLDGLFDPQWKPTGTYRVLSFLSHIRGHSIVGKRPKPNLTVVGAISRRTGARLIIGRHDECGTPPRPAPGEELPASTCGVRSTKITTVSKLRFRSLAPRSRVRVSRCVLAGDTGLRPVSCRMRHKTFRLQHRWLTIRCKGIRNGDAVLIKIIPVKQTTHRERALSDVLAAKVAATGRVGT